MIGLRGDRGVWGGRGFCSEANRLLLRGLLRGCFEANWLLLRVCFGVCFEFASGFCFGGLLRVCFEANRLLLRVCFEFASGFCFGVASKQIGLCFGLLRVCFGPPWLRSPGRFQTDCSTSLPPSRPSCSPDLPDLTRPCLGLQCLGLAELGVLVEVVDLKPAVDDLEDPKLVVREIRTGLHEFR